MRKITFLLLITFGLIVSTKADTLSYCHVYYNKTKKIADFVLAYGEQTVIIKLADISKADSITVSYFQDTPCSDCLTSLLIDDNKGNQIFTESKKGSFSKHTFSAKSLVDTKNSKKTFDVFYSESVATKPWDKLLFLFHIKLE